MLGSVQAHPKPFLLPPIFVLILLYFINCNGKAHTTKRNYSITFLKISNSNLS